MKSSSSAVVVRSSEPVASSAPRLALVVDEAPPPALTIDAELIAKLQPTLVRVALRFVGSQAQAEDVVQDTWMSALTCAHSYEGRSTVLTWLVAIMRRRVCDVRRRSGYRMQELDESSWISQPLWAEQLHARDCLESLEETFERLSELEREAIVLCDVRDLDRDEAAEALMVSRGHLRVLLHRGRLRVRETLLAGTERKRPQHRGG